MLEGSTTGKTTLRTSLVLIWLDDGPYSSQSFDKAIDPTTEHEDQLMEISSFFNTHTHTKRYPLTWTKSDKLYLPTLQVVVWLNQLAQGIQHGFLEKGWFTGINQLDHELNIAVRWQPGNTYEKIFGKLRTTVMLLSSRTILLLRARRHDQMVFL